MEVKVGHQRLKQIQLQVRRAFAGHDAAVAGAKALASSGATGRTKRERLAAALNNLGSAALASDTAAKAAAQLKVDIRKAGADMDALVSEMKTIEDFCDWLVGQKQDIPDGIDDATRYAGLQLGQTTENEDIASDLRRAAKSVLAEIHRLRPGGSVKGKNFWNQTVWATTTAASKSMAVAAELAGDMVAAGKHQRAAERATMTARSLRMAGVR